MLKHIAAVTVRPLIKNYITICYLYSQLGASVDFVQIERCMCTLLLTSPIGTFVGESHSEKKQTNLNDSRTRYKMEFSSYSNY